MMRPNTIPDDMKIEWLAAFDGKIAVDVFLLGLDETEQFRYGEDDLQRDLLVRFPHDDIYPAMLRCEIDAALGEMKKFENDQVLFNQKMKEFELWYLSTYDPIQEILRPECEDEEYGYV